MAARLFLLHSVTDFAPGFFSDTVVAGGNIQLKRDSGAFPKKGCYTSPIYHAAPFFKLIASWNADTPPGTRVEMQLRVQTDDRWSRWFSCGVWSVYEGNQQKKATQDEIARMQGGTLTLTNNTYGAEALQMRVWLHTTDEQKTPLVRMLSCSTNTPLPNSDEPVSHLRQLELPAYSCQNRDPAIAGRCAGVTTVTMLMNRWGRDLLPEEVARMVYDAEAGSYDNLSFLAAAAGMYGFSSHVQFAGLEALRHEVWQGRAVAARVHYRAPALQEEEDGAQAAGLAPILEGAAVNSSGHLVAVHGFVQQNGQEYVLLNDPMMPTDEESRCEIPLSTFGQIYTGLALFLARGAKGAGHMRPQRRLAEVTVRDSALYLQEGTDALIPEKLRDGDLGPTTICYTLSDGIAYASSAQKQFYYPTPDEAGIVRFDRAGAAGRRMTLYLIASGGRTWVAEKQL